MDDELPFLTKAEWMNPTCSFKDCGVSAMVTALKALEARRILEDSSGDAEASVAAYPRAAGIEATIVVPSSTSSQKVEQMEDFGAKVCRVAGTRDHVADESRRMAQDIPCASHNWSPYFLHGIKTLGYEIWENLGNTIPDNIVAVAGSGTIALGLDLAFTELKDCREIAASPRIFIGQPRG